MPDRTKRAGGDSARGDDRPWAVIATIGPVVRIADIHMTHAHAEADRLWREQQVKAYLGFLEGHEQPVPRYTIRPMSRAQLPRGWRRMPALGFLNGRMG